MQTYTAPLVTREDVDAGVVQERLEAGAEIVVQDRPVLAAQLVLRRVGVIDVVGRVAERHVRELPAEHPLDVGQHRGVAAQQAVVAQDPEVARLADRLLRRLRDLVLGLVARRLAVGDRQQPLQLRGIEADQVEVEALVPQPGQLLPPAAPRSIPPAGRAGCPRSGTPASAPRSGARTGSPAPRPARASSPPAAGRGRRGCRPARRPGPGWSSRTRPSSAAIWSTCASLCVRGIALVRAQAVDRPELDPVGERDQPGALRCVGQRANLCGANLVRRPSQASQLRTSGILRLSADRVRRGGANLECDGVRRQVRTRRSPKARDSAAFGGSGANLSATGATGRFAPLRAQKSRNSAAFRLSSATGRCELRTRIRGLSLAKYRAAPPRISIRQGRTQISLTGSSITFRSLTSDIVAAVYPNITNLYRSPLMNYKAVTRPNRSVPSAAKQPAWDRGGLSGTHSASLS